MSPNQLTNYFLFISRVLLQCTMGERQSPWEVGRRLCAAPTDFTRRPFPGPCACGCPPPATLPLARVANSSHGSSRGNS